MSMELCHGGNEDPVHARIREQRDHWMEMAELYRRRARVAEAIIQQIDCKMGVDWTKELADALTPGKTKP